MTENITLEDVYQLFQESERLRQAAEARFQQQLQESDQRFQQQLAALERQREASQAGFQQQMAELEQRRAVASARVERQVERTSRAVDNLTTRWGTFVENLVEPGLVQLFQERGIEVDQTFRRMRSRKQGAAMEIDIFAVNGDVAVAVEVKSRLNQEAVTDFTSRLQRFKQAFPQYASYRIYGAIAGIEILAGVDLFAYRQGLFVIKQAGDAVIIANDAQFQPTSW